MEGPPNAQKPKVLLNKIRNLLLEIGKLPMTGTTRADMAHRISRVVMADQVANTALINRSRAMHDVVHWATTGHNVKLTACIDDIIVEFFE